jgi:hypothetical protein
MDRLTGKEESQILNYLKATGFKAGLSTLAATANWSGENLSINLSTKNTKKTLRILRVLCGWNLFGGAASAAESPKIGDPWNLIRLIPS